MKKMSARALKLLSPFTWRLPVLYRCSSSSSAGDSKDVAKPKKPEAAASAPPSPPPPPPPAPEVKFDNSKYQAGQLYKYNHMSFYDLEMDMSPSRCPQPSSLKKSS